MVMVEAMPPKIDTHHGKPCPDFAGAATTLRSSTYTDWQEAFAWFVSSPSGRSTFTLLRHVYEPPPMKHLVETCLKEMIIA